MKFTKKSNSQLIAHLYEHIFFIHLDTALRISGFFPIIDYSLDAFTEDGEVTLDFNTFREIDVIQAITQAGGNFFSIEDLLEISIAQLESEYQQEILTDDIQGLKSNLVKINNESWNSDTVINVVQNARLHNSIEIQRLELTFIYPKIDRDLLPLYRLIAGVTLNTLASDVADTLGGFVASKTFEIDEDKSLIAHIHLTNLTEEKGIRDLYHETVRDLTDKSGYRRLIDDLANTDVMTMPPSNEKAYTETGVKMDTKKWAKIATNENLITIIGALDLKIRQAIIL